jgi:hypothetical protein
MSGPRSSSLYGIIPTPSGTQQPQFSPPLGLLGTAENFSQGMGRGIQNQLIGLLGIAKQPKQYLNALWQMGLISPKEGSPMLRNALSGMVGKAMSGPSGLGEVLGENVSMRGLLGVNALSKPGPVHEMTAYHGSPHDFDEFKLEKIGTGEGAQVYGHGLYFAESPDVARTYQYVGQPSYSGTLPKSFADEALRKSGGNKKDALKDLQTQFDALSGTKKYSEGKQRQYIQDAINNFDTLVDNKVGKFYHVDIPDDAVAKMLDWDAPIGQQPKSIQEALKTAFKSRGFNDGQIAAQFEKNITGQQAYVYISGILGEKAGSETLMKAGIPGIRYLDAGSRGAGNGTRNMVLFDDKLVKMLKKE